MYPVYPIGRLCKYLYGAFMGPVHSLVSYVVMLQGDVTYGELTVQYIINDFMT